MTAADIVRLLLVVCIVAMAVFALYYLSRRKLSAYEYAAWGLLAILVPLLGPFLVIYMRPGEKES